MNHIEALFVWSFLGFIAGFLVGALIWLLDHVRYRRLINSRMEELDYILKIMKSRVQPYQE